MECMDLVGKTLSKIEINEAEDEIIFVEDNGKKYRMFHFQDYYEDVFVADKGLRLIVCGNLEDIIGLPIIRVSKDSNSKYPPKRNYPSKSYTWTFYNIATAKGYVTIRWYGESNGYYSEEVNFTEIKKEEQC